MPAEIISIERKFACTVGLAVFNGVAGTVGSHSHWVHQIAIDLDGKSISCFCDGEMFTSSGVFVPAGHAHAVEPGRQLNLFFDASVGWIDELFGGKLDTSCARVLDRGTLEGIQSCFFEGTSLVPGMGVFVDAFDLKIQNGSSHPAMEKWQAVMEKVKKIKAESDEIGQVTYSKLGGLFQI